jgi:hypothetical protein
MAETLRFPIGTIIEAYGIPPWNNEINADYEIIGHTTITELEMVKLDYYELRFTGKDLDSLYKAYYVNNIGVYIAKPVQRRPYLRVDPPKEGEDEDKPVEFEDVVYFSDLMLDMTRVKILQKRANLIAHVNIGNYDFEGITADFKDRLTTELKVAASKFSDKYYLEEYTADLFLQRQEESQLEDDEFARIQEEIADEVKRKADAELARLNGIIARENKIKGDEAQISKEQTRLEEYAKDLQVQASVLEDRTDSLDFREQSLNVKAEELANLEYELRIREQRVYDRENALGLPHSL